VAKSPDGLNGEEDTFTICTFWQVEALSRAGRIDRVRLEEVRLVFERMPTYTNHLGLYAKETGPRREALGNSFTYLAQICVAFNLDRALGGG
jgi:GH15 family glucan-1,4-alpha-glucosidase